MGAKLSCKLAYSREGIPKSPFMPTVVVILEAHHQTALDQDGEHTLENGLTVCRDCHIKLHKTKENSADSLAWDDFLREIMK